MKEYGGFSVLKTELNLNFSFKTDFAGNNYFFEEGMSVFECVAEDLMMRNLRYGNEVSW